MHGYYWLLLVELVVLVGATAVAIAAWVASPGDPDLAFDAFLVILVLGVVLTAQGFLLLVPAASRRAPADGCGYTVMLWLLTGVAFSMLFYFAVLSALSTVDD